MNLKIASMHTNQLHPHNKLNGKNSSEIMFTIFGDLNHFSAKKIGDLIDNQCCVFCVHGSIFITKDV
jgi:hypothetical protein